MRENKNQETNTHSRSDQELIELFMTALSTGSELRLLRIGGPKGFRKAVISKKSVNPADFDPFISPLLSSDIPFIKVLFADPHSEPFLKRLDQEKASCWKIWRVRKELLQLAQSMLNIAGRREFPSSLAVGFHQDELIWNLGIVGQDDVLVRPYGNVTVTGHDDSIQAHRINSSETDILARSFFRYFEALSTRLDTIWLFADVVNLNAEPRWPSLYKGNAIRASLSDEDGTAEPELQTNEIAKICLDPRSNNAEEQWLGIKRKLRENQMSFRPGEVIRPLADFRGHGIVARKIHGPSLFELAVSLNTASDQGYSSPCRSTVLDVLLKDSLKALIEFRDLAGDVLPSDERVTYPYAAKLASAITEIRKHCAAIPDDIWLEALEDSGKLGKELEQDAEVPFRDAHLKNRIWHEDCPAEEIIKSLLSLPPEELSNRTKAYVKDIDFETAFYNVTKWDDPFHILMFEYSALERHLIDAHRTEIWNKYSNHFGSIADMEVWRTGLARATREFARRVWYKNVMPNTYVQRYSKESPDFFLRLALECSNRCSGFLKLRRLLEALEAYCNFGDFKPGQYNTAAPPHCSLKPIDDFAHAQTQKMEISSHLSATPEVPHQPGRVGRALRVFISYSHNDEKHRDKLEETLVLLKRNGLIETIWSDRSLFPGDEWDKKITLELNEADLIIFLVSRDFLASPYCEVEIRSALERYEAGAAAVVPIVVSPVVLENTSFFHIHALPKEGKPIITWQFPDEAWVDVEKEIQKLCLRLKSIKQ